MANSPRPVRRQSVAEFFSAFDRRPHDIAYAQSVGYRTERWTYLRFAETAAQFARELESRGIAAGERVLIWGPNSAEWAAAFWGCILRGAVVVPMDWIASEDFARRVATQVQAKLVVVAREKTAAVTNFPVLVLEELTQIVTRHPSGRRYARYDTPKLDRSALAEIVFTSGTTAEPKGVLISHGNILANLEPIEQEIRKNLIYEWPFHPIRFLNLLPLSHVFGQFLGLFLPAVLTGTVFFQESFNPSDVIRTIHEDKISVLVAVPRVLDALKNKIERDAESAGRAEKFAAAFAAEKDKPFYRHWLRFFGTHRQFGLKFWAMICGGASLPHDVEEFWDRLGFAVIQGYGLTETTSLISLNHPFSIGHGSIGKILPGREIMLSATGEILVRGESVASGYWQGAQPAVRTESDQWLHTGDVGQLDAAGNLYFKGRQKNVIVSPAGMNIYPEDLEAALRRQPEIRDCIVIPQPGDESEALAVLLLREPSADSSPVLQRANAPLADYQRVRRFFVWPDPDFPRTSTGKPRTDLIAARVAAPSVAAPSIGRGGGAVADLIARITGISGAQLNPTAKLESDLGLSSLDRVELLSALEDRYQVSINEAELSADTTIGDLQRLIGQSAAVGAGVASGQGASARPSDVASAAAMPSAASPQPAFLYPRWAQRWPAVWTRNFVYTILTWPATHLLAHPRVRGRENLDGIRGPLLIVCNHISEVDTGYIAAALPPRFRYRLAIAMGGERLRGMRHPPAARGFFGGLLDRLNYFLVTLLFNVFPLPKLSGFRESFHFAGESVDRGYNLIVFPEGDITPDGALHEFRSGVGLLAQNLHIPILPMRIDGLFELRVQQKRTAPWGHVRVSIGNVVTFPPETPPRQIAGELHDLVASLEWD
jgi:long-chain acyl-CoA synthetase